MRKIEGNHKFIGAGTGTRVTTHIEERTEAADPQFYLNGERKIKESVKDGRERYEWEATVDITNVEHMAYLAAINKTGICRRGGLKVKITSREKLPL